MRQGSAGHGGRWTCTPSSRHHVKWGHTPAHHTKHTQARSTPSTHLHHRQQLVVHALWSQHAQQLVQALRQRDTHAHILAGDQGTQQLPAARDVIGWVEVWAGGRRLGILATLAPLQAAQEKLATWG